MSEPSPGEPVPGVAERVRAAMEAVSAMRADGQASRGMALAELRRHLPAMWGAIGEGVTRKAIHAKLRESGITISYAHFARFLAENPPPEPPPPPKPPSDPSFS